MGFIALQSVYRLPDLTDQIVRIAVVSLVLIFVSRHVIDLRAPHWILSLVIGAAVFALWIGPDFLFPNYRHFWLFENALFPKGTGLTQAGQMQPAVLALRAVRAIIIVPIVEELFWRGWLMRWIINPDFEKIPLGAYTPLAFWTVAILFASEHGSYWDVGLLTGIDLQLLDDRSSKPGRSDSDARGHQCLPERLCGRRREMGILVISCFVKNA